MPVRVKDVAHVATKDIDPQKGVDTKILDRLVNRSILRATSALETSIPNFSSFQRQHLGSMFESLGYTHHTIRYLLKLGTSDPSSADALVVGRLQLEALYSVCLMLEDPQYINTYLKDSWRKTYVRYLLEKEECKNLPRFSDFLNKSALPLLKALKQFAGVNDDEVATVEMEELGVPLPTRRTVKQIGQFPTPARIIAKVRSSSRKRMLKRLYPEYQLLSSYVHGTSTSFHMFKNLFNPRSKYRNLLPTGKIELMFQKEVGESAIYIDYICLVQSCTELVEIYPNDVELRATLSDAWAPLVEGSLLGRAIWDIRSRTLLGVIG